MAVGLINNLGNLNSILRVIIKMLLERKLE
jgi:hypothetical protein